MLFGKGWHQRVRLALGCPLLPVLLVLAVDQGAKIRDKGRPVFGFVADAAGGCIKLFALFADGWLDMAVGTLALKNGLPVLCGGAEIGSAFLLRAFRECLGSVADGDTRLERDDALSVTMVMVLVMTPLLPRISIVTGMPPFCPAVMIQGRLGNRATVQPQEESARLIRTSPPVLF